ncbi:Uma2 family endonuclease [Neolewinella lacunae]|uniref:Uma2 family endonuclease n=1 Tax=Neolewinella lacunae TaxID=1517758 RepID=A0A923PPH8_9BACT|nr:Uma2 family endonuclease [Neolewinella lacunae]MBC6995416.1 Uma2 family endonuclease [Neolewinella lacunae]MDN3633841.1 Uma2 family endonuclease [Neolewinella lacunae]
MPLELTIPEAEVELNFPTSLSNEAFEALCLANKELLIERDPDGKIKVMSPVSGKSGRSELKFNGQLYNYVVEHGGESFSSSTGFALPDGSVKSPDACYVTALQMASLTETDLNHFVPLVPDFVVEVISPTDQLKAAAAKMTTVWIANGVRLGWLVDVENEKLWIYRQNGTVSLVEGFEQVVTGEDVLPGFSFDLRLLR